MAFSVAQTLNAVRNTRPQAKRSTRTTVCASVYNGPSSAAAKASEVRLTHKFNRQAGLKASRFAQQKSPRADRIAVKAESTETEAATSTEQGQFVPVLSVENLPKGTRETINLANGKTVLLFWYRNEVVAIESRSPAEGAFSTGFFNSQLTQNACIECPATESLFNFKTGAIEDWYPTNAVLRAITPQDTCRPLEVFPCRVVGDQIEVDPFNTNLANASEEERAKWGNATQAGMTGGSETSLENNNVFAIEPEVYLESGETVVEDNSEQKVDAATLVISTLAVAIVSVAGTATCLYYENIPALVALWVAGFGGVALFVYNTTLKDDMEKEG